MKDEIVLYNKRPNSFNHTERRNYKPTYTNKRNYINNYTISQVNKPYVSANITLTISLIIIVIYALYKIEFIKNIPCEKDVLSILKSNFVHTDGAHLMANLYGLYAVSNIETKLGTDNFVWLFIFILVISTLTEYIIKQTFDIKCSIGISGILMGLLTWNIIISNKVNGKHNLESIIAVVILVAYPSIKCKNSSLSGHLAGALSGFFATLFYNKF
jgi:membrane associated rhomboid family serine protease